MSTEGLNVAVPDRMDFSYDENSIEYTEVYIADDEGVAESVAETTQELAMMYAKHLEDENGDEIDVDVNTEVNDHYVEATVKITPGRPEGAENIGIAAIAGEIMGTLAVADPLMWNTVVKATEGSAEDMFTEMRDMLLGLDE